ncbi:hypothetical protein VN97_g9262 [Penicillium thymicola]|uniref:Uncharacterized protein n=1 Tax=Penicillium thymicola TaxID=293382 RepID=A0AAI9TB64_PENTH|nr:hypothetical protein VN97_g9262 [Penicillium thymicola]
MVPHSRVLNPRTGHTMNITHERTILLQNVDLQVISISVCVPVHHKRGSKDPLRGKRFTFISHSQWFNRIAPGQYLNAM